MLFLSTSYFTISAGPTTRLAPDLLHGLGEATVVFIDKGWAVVHTSGIMPLKRFVLVVFVLTASFVMGTGQVEHAPTVAQCQADQRLWFAEIEADAKGSNKGLPTLAVIRAWHSEMMDCQDVDPDNRYKYSNTHSEITAEELLRLRHFMDRHDLWEKFIAEDAAGKR